MHKTATVTLDEAVDAARKLPRDKQAAVAAELMEYVEALSPPDRPDDRQALIKARARQPLKAISRDDLMAMLRKYNPDL
jgi:uncharacterized membrane protein